MLHPLNITTLNTLTDTHEIYPEWGWRAATGEMTLLCGTAYTVLREGMRGFSEINSEHNLIANPSNMGEFVSHTIERGRECVFDVLIRGRDRDELLSLQQKLIEALSTPGELLINRDYGRSLALKARCANGYPAIDGGLPKGTLAKHRIATIRLFAPDPYFYGAEISAVSTDGELTIYNPGDRPAPCTIACCSREATNETSGRTISAVTTSTLEGVTIEVSDTSVKITANGENAARRIAWSSQFWMLMPGKNELHGVSKIQFRPRWSGI